MSHQIAFFDFDGTLVKGDSLLPFLRWLNGSWRYLADLLMVSPWLLGYLLKLISNQRAKEVLLARSLQGSLLSELRARGGLFSEQIIPQMLRSDVIAKLKFHQQQGHTCVLVSASLDIYLEQWSQHMGIDYCLCSRLATDINGNVSGKLLGDNCYGLEKVRRIQQLFTQIGKPTRSYAYGDSKGDLPMLKMVDEGYWVGNDLRRI